MFVCNFAHRLYGCNYLFIFNGGCYYFGLFAHTSREMTTSSAIWDNRDHNSTYTTFWFI